MSNTKNTEIFALFRRSTLLLLLLTGLIARLSYAQDTVQEQQPEQQIQPTDSDKSVSETIVPQQILPVASEPESEVEQISSKLSNINPGEQNRLQKSLQENPWMFLHPYEATYDISAEGDKLGNAYRSMSSLSGVWNVAMSTKLKKWFLTFKSKEYSNFVIRENEMNTIDFFSGTSLTFKKDRTIEQKFDWQQKLETGHKDNKQPWTLPIDGMVFDRMSHLVQLRADLLLNRQEFSYLISYKGKRFTYTYTIEKSEKISTPFGDYNTVKLIRTSGDDSQFSIWLSPELNYFPIKIAQYEQDKPDVELLLKKLEFITPDQVIGK